VLALGDGSSDVGNLWRERPAHTVLLGRSARTRVL
jgi:hypothetical protein